MQNSKTKLNYVALMNEKVSFVLSPVFFMRIQSSYWLTTGLRGEEETEEDPILVVHPNYVIDF